MQDRTEMSKDVETLDVSYMEEFVQDDDSLDSLKDHFIPSVLKKLESGSNPQELVDEYGPGSIILTPQNECIWRKNDKPFQFIPILFTPVVRKWLDFDDPEGPSVVDFSFDMGSQLARIGRNAEQRNSEEYGTSGFKYQYVEHLMFTGVLYDGEHTGTQCTMSFERSGHFKGLAFNSAIRGRKITINNVLKPQPMWSQVWGFELVEKHNFKGRWHALNFRTVQPTIIDEQHAKPFKKLYDTWKEMQKKRQIKFVDETTANDMNEDDGNM